MVSRAQVSGGLPSGWAGTVAASAREDDRRIDHFDGFMKDQYAGDINDYLKYTLLRVLAGAHPGTLQVCWMRTADDGRTDGRRLSYLADAATFREFDPPVFDALARVVASGARSVKAIQATDILCNACFHAEILRDDLDARAAYFAEVWDKLGSEDLVFFDPDNGLEVASVRLGRRNSSKYLFWDELKHALGEMRSACIYQHFPRRPRAAFIDTLLEELSQRFPDHSAFAVSSPWVAYLVCGRPAMTRALHEAAIEVAVRSSSHLAVAPLELLKTRGDGT